MITFDKKQLKLLSEYTNENNHTAARFFIAMWIEDDALKSLYDTIEDIRLKEGSLDGGICTIRTKIDDLLFARVRHKVSNHKEVMACL